MKKIGFGLSSAVLVAAAGFALGVPNAARADVITLQLNTPNTAIAGFTGPYADVTINRTSTTTATITFTSDTSGGNIYLMGDGSSVGVNVNAATWTITGLTSSNAGTGFTTPTLTDDGSKNVSGFGVINQTVKSSDGFPSSSDTISFILTDTSGTWSSASNVLTPGSGGFEAVAHIFVTTFPANASNSAIVTGFAGNGTGPAVPEPSTWAMMLLGFLGLGFAFRQSRRKVSFA
jgi:hypothetical protein